MTLSFSDFPDAPEVGTPLCTVESVKWGVTSLSVGEFPILFVSDTQGTRAFVNACPHQFLPLDTRGEVLGADGTRLICTNHDAAFDAQTGEGIAGFGLNCALTPIPLRNNDVNWVVG
jgi:nitrite reductase/ring-hydroxylating ferredoxin subunit